MPAPEGVLPFTHHRVETETLSGKRSASEIEQIIADIHLKNRQHQTEVGKVGILLVVATAAVVQAINLIWPIGGT
jgi:hypothetical protein